MKKGIWIFIIIIGMLYVTACESKNTVVEDSISFDELSADYKIGTSKIGEEIIVSNVPIQSKEDLLLGKVTYGVVCSNIDTLEIPNQGKLKIKGTVGEVTGEYSIYIIECELIK